ncbi:calphotin-like [Galleria mellonella]|uniref:Calphotin-like n=1 Tax=Galleria mellonella TaxID=7137 RepID=A0A6J1X1Y7_GALME|nr:calphotin-like [Galleria mellonella]
MKFLAVFVAVLAVAAGTRHRWTVSELSEAIQNPITSPSLLPALKHGLNAYMEAIFSGLDYEYIYISTAAVDLSTWTLQDLSSALENPETDPTLIPYLEEAINALMQDIFAGSAQPSTSVVIPARDLSYWRLNELYEALLSSETSTDLAPYLINGLNILSAAGAAGKEVDAVVLAIPLDLLPSVEVAVHPEAIVDPEPQPIVPEPQPILPEPVPVPIPEPTPETPAAPVAPSNSPLVQIILNINQENQASVDVPASNPVVERPVPEITVEPVHIIDRPIPEATLNPVDVISPPIPLPEYNPIDVIAVVPNPAGNAVGPIV